MYLPLFAKGLPLKNLSDPLKVMYQLSQLIACVGFIITKVLQLFVPKKKV
jgi:hypothetical protein